MDETQGPSSEPPRVPEGWLGKYGSLMSSGMISNNGSAMGWSKSKILLCPESNWTSAMVSSQQLVLLSDYQAYTAHREVPTEPALSVPTPDPTPQPRGDPFERPGDPNRSYGSDRGVDEGTDRSMLSVSNLATIAFIVPDCGFSGFGNERCDGREAK